MTRDKAWACIYILSHFNILMDLDFTISA